MPVLSPESSINYIPRHDFKVVRCDYDELLLQYDHGCPSPRNDVLAWSGKMRLFFEVVSIVCYERRQSKIFEKMVTVTKS